jgi:hypothetical protein
VSDPIGSCRPASSGDAILHRVLDVRPEASALPTPDAAPDSAREGAVHRDEHGDPIHDLHEGAAALETVATGVEVAEPVLEHGGLLVAGELGPQAIVTAVASQLLAVWGTLREGEERGVDIDSAQMQGALAVLEGRLDDPDVQARAAVDEGFASGARAMQRLFHSDNEAFMCAAAQVRAIVREGERAVILGDDHGPEFERRYESDLAYRHGVERARERRESSPAEHEAQRREILDYQRRMEEARGSSAIRG